MSDLRGFSTRGSGAQRSLAHLPQVDDKLLNHAWCWIPWGYFYGVYDFILRLFLPQSFYLYPSMIVSFKMRKSVV